MSQCAAISAEEEKCVDEEDTLGVGIAAEQKPCFCEVTVCSLCPPSVSGDSVCFVCVHILNQSMSESHRVCEEFS